jgi:hypothetical protein
MLHLYFTSHLVGRPNRQSYRLLFGGNLALFPARTPIMLIKVDHDFLHSLRASTEIATHLFQYRFFAHRFQFTFCLHSYYRRYAIWGNDSLVKHPCMLFISPTTPSRRHLMLLIIFGEGTIYRALRYAVFLSLVFGLPPWTQIVSSAPCSQFLSIHVLPLGWGKIFENNTKQQLISIVARLARGVCRYKCAFFQSNN